MSKGIYRTAMGQLIDMDNLRLQNEQQPAIGNMNVNARGDDILSDGTIVKPRNQKMREHYTEPQVRYNPHKKHAAVQPDVKPEIVEPVITEEEEISIKPVAAPAQKQQTKPTKEK